MTQESYYARNKEKVKARVAAWRNANKEKSAASDKAYYQENKETLRARNKARYEAAREERSAYAKAKRAELKSTPEGRAQISANRRKDRQTPWGRFRIQKSSASRRGIEWDLTFEQWMDWWGEDYSRRGTGPNDLVMARYGDVGPYSLDNIKKITSNENKQEAHLGKKRSEETRKRISEAKLKHEQRKSK